MSHDVDSVGKIIRAENNPGQTSQQESACQHDCFANFCSLPQSQCVIELIAQILGQPPCNQIEAVQQAPPHISPIRAVPQAADPEGDEHIGNVAFRVNPASAQRDIE